MQITKNTVVQFHYTLKDLQGNTLESTQGEDPVAYLHGYNNMMPAIEEKLVDKTVGDVLQFELTPEQAYGPRNEELIQRIPAKHLRGAKKWKAGMLAEVDAKDGPRQVMVVKAGKFMVDVDLNHPFAGKDLQFDITVVDVREATAEEIAHKHAHGPGGHHH